MTAIRATDVHLTADGPASTGDPVIDELERKLFADPSGREARRG